MGSCPRAQTLSQPHSSSRGRELIRDIKSWERAYQSYLHVIMKESVWYAKFILEKKEK